jgi:2-hydroxy-6-oxonona-2,4-dienedioate hydrolase
MEIITLATARVYTVLLDVKTGMAGRVKAAGARVARRTCEFGGRLLTKLKRDDFEGRSRRLPGENFAVRPKLWRFAWRAAVETRRRPAGLGRMQARRLEADLPLWVRASAARAPGDLAVVLVHGVIVSSRYLMPLGDELAADFPVVVPDLPGYGLSDPPPSPPTVAELADAVVASARAAGHRRLALVGNSFGAQIAVEAALRHPDLIERLVLIDLTTDPTARSLPRQFLRWARCGVDEHLSILPVLSRDLADLGPRQTVHLVRVMMRDRPEQKLPRVRQPTLVVRGGRDRLVPAAWAREAAELLPAGRLVTVPGYAHMPHWSAALVTAPILRDFLAADKPG